MKQTTFASAAWDKKGKVTRRERFLAEMDAVIPWAAILALIEPHYPKAGNGTQPMPLERMLRIYFMQQWFNLSDPAAEDSLYDSESMRRFAGIELVEDAVPDESTILRFRHLLEQHKLTEQIFALVRGLLEQKRLLLKSGTIVDATIIHAPSSTKNSSGERDPEMHQTRKGKQWYFGLKAHIGVDSKQGVVHTGCTTAASVADKHMLPDLLHGEERKVWGDGGYQGQTEAIREAAPHAQDMTCRRTKFKNYVDEEARRKNTTKSRVRAKVEHVFRILKRIFGFDKTRYRGIAKNHNRLCANFALVNLYMHRKRLAVLG